MAGARRDGFGSCSRRSPRRRGFSITWSVVAEASCCRGACVLEEQSTLRLPWRDAVITRRRQEILRHTGRAPRALITFPCRPAARHPPCLNGVGTPYGRSGFSAIRAADISVAGRSSPQCFWNSDRAHEFRQPPRPLRSALRSSRPLPLATIPPGRRHLRIARPVARDHRSRRPGAAFQRVSRTPLGAVWTRARAASTFS